MDKIDRIMEITNRYLERFGKALIGIYYLPPLAENWKFTVFINSLLVTLAAWILCPDIVGLWMPMKDIISSFGSMAISEVICGC